MVTETVAKGTLHFSQNSIARHQSDHCTSAKPMKHGSSINEVSRYSVIASSRSFGTPITGQSKAHGISIRLRRTLRISLQRVARDNCCEFRRTILPARQRCRCPRDTVYRRVVLLPPSADETWSSTPHPVRTSEMSAKSTSRGVVVIHFDVSLSCDGINSIHGVV